MDFSTAAWLHTVSNDYAYREIAVPVLTEGSFSLAYQPLPEASTRNFPPDEGLIEGEYEVFFAVLDGAPVGQIVISANWNGCAFLHDLRVHPAQRGRGIGSALLAYAEQWARTKGLGGVMLETQTIDAPACRLYEKCGYRLGGVDHLLYAALGQAETALFFYKVFDTEFRSNKENS